MGLTVMMMTLFAEVFRSATSMITLQKGIAENDARERTIQTMMLNDFKKLTFSELVPFQGGVGHDTRLLDSLDAREGYLSISENDPNNNLDDVIAFTVRTTRSAAGFDSSIPFYGKATSLQNTPLTGVTAGSGGSGEFSVGVDLVAGGYLPDPVQIGDKINIQGASPPNVNGVYTIAGYNTSGNTTISVYEPVVAATSIAGARLFLSRSLGNEPEFDDGQFLINNTGLSTIAEVMYYVRNGNLYRRQLLIREPHEPQTDPSAPISETGTPLINGNYTTTGNSFWNDFDYSAHRIVGEDVNENGQLDTGEDINGNTMLDGYGIRFHTNGDLSNAGSGVVYSLGLPQFRYGHAPSLGGVPREFLSGPDLQPGVAGVDDNGDGVVDDPGEWGWAGSDDIFIGRFTQQETAHVDFQYPGNIVPGLNPMNRSGMALNPATGAVTAYEGLLRRGEDVIATNVHEFDIKVFAADFGADGAPGVELVDDDGDGFVDWLDPPYNTVPDLEEVGVAGSDDLVGFYDLGRTDTVAAPQVSGLYTANMNGNWSYGNRFDTWHVNGPGRTPYRIRSNGEDGRPGLADWDDDGDGYIDNYYTVGPDGAPGVAGVDDDGNGVVDDESELGWAGSDDIFGGELGFIGTDDEVPLRAIQIRIRFMDAASNQMRQMTMVFSLDDLK